MGRGILPRPLPWEPEPGPLRGGTAPPRGGPGALFSGERSKACLRATHCTPAYGGPRVVGLGGRNRWSRVEGLSWEEGEGPVGREVAATPPSSKFPNQTGSSPRQYSQVNI